MEKLDPEVQAIVAECMRRSKRANEGETEARLRGETEYAAYLLGVEHAYTAAYYQLLNRSFTEEAWKP